MTAVETDETGPTPEDDARPPFLGLPEEPTDLRARLRAEVLDGADRDPGLEEIADHLWATWGPTLEPAGLDRAAFGPVVTGYRRELWLWLMGDRRWDQAVPALAGRALRRLPPA